MSAPNVVPFVVTNRTGNDIASVVCRWFVVSLPRATVTGCSPKAKAASRVALLDWRNGVRTFSATFCKRTSQSYFIGALAAAPGSAVMLRASPARLLQATLVVNGLRGPVHPFLNIFSIAQSNLHLSWVGQMPVLRKHPPFEASLVRV